MKKLFLLFLTALFSSMLLAQLPLGMVDVTSALIAADETFELTTEDDRAGTFRSTLEVIGDIMFFTATNATSGDELYVTDGTVEGTMLLKDINPGSGDASPRYLIVLGDKLYFQANDGSNGIELWESDGTEAGTQMVADLNAIGDGAPDMLTPLDGKVLFRATTPASEAAGEKWLHIYDPATGNAELVAEIQARESGDAQIRRIQVDNVHNVAYFIGQPANENEEMYITDGTGAGTYKLIDVCPPDFTASGIQWPFVSQDRYMLWRQNTPRKYAGADSVNYTKALGEQLWVYDIVEDSVYFLSHFNKTVLESGDGDGTQYAWPIDYNGKCYFRAHDGVHHVELSTTDFTPEGTKQIVDINPGADPSWVEDWAIFRDTLVFNGNAGNGAEGGELRYLNLADPDNPTVELYAYANPGDAGSWPKRNTTWQVDDKDSMVFMVAEGASTGGPELFVAKGVGNQAEFVGSVGAAGSTPHNLTSWKNKLFFTTVKVKRLFSYVYTVEPKINVAGGPSEWKSGNIYDTAAFAIDRYQPDLFTNLTVKIQLKEGETGALLSTTKEGPYSTDPLYLAEGETDFYVLPDYSSMELSSVVSTVTLEALSPDVPTAEIGLRIIIAPFFHNELLYLADFGNPNDTLGTYNMDMLGSYQSVYDQVYGADPVTGKTWGIERSGWGWETSSDKWTSMREQNYGENPDGLLYGFELEPGDYVIQYGWYEHWGARMIDVIVNGETKVDDLMSIPQDYIVGEFEVSQADNKLIFNVISSDGGDNPYLSWIKIGVKCTENCESNCFGDPICELFTGGGTSIVTNPVQDVSIYPNPANDVLYIQLDQDLHSSLSIYDMSGALIQSNILDSQVSSVDISNLEHGLYVLKVSNESGLFVSKLIVDSH